MVQRNTGTLEELKNSIDLLLINMGMLTRKFLPEAKIDKSVSIPSVPLESLEEFDRFEKWMASQSNEAALVSIVCVAPFPFLDSVF